MPCDTGVCKYSPSPGDPINGCGLSAPNEFVVWLYSRWAVFGDTAFTLANVHMTPWEAENLMEAFMLIKQYEPAIQEAYAKRKT